MKFIGASALGECGICWNYLSDADTMENECRSLICGCSLSDADTKQNAAASSADANTKLLSVKVHVTCCSRVCNK